MSSTAFRTQLWINGAYVNAKSGDTFVTLNPATNSPICSVQAAGAEDIDAAVAAARACLNSPNWGYASTGAQRAAVLRKLGAIFVEKKAEIAELDSLDQGKPLREANADMDDAITACEYFAGLAESREEEIVDNGTEGVFQTRIVHEPIGVIGAITPWNYPILMALWKIIPAIACGCTVVLKPSELAPLSCIWLGEMCQQAGLPDGALNIVPGLGHPAGSALSNHTGVDKLSFTGSLPTAQKIMMGAAGGPRALSLELGGKSPLIVFDDAPIEATVDWILTGVLWGSGQVCSSTSRVLLQSGIREKVMARLLERIAAVKIGDSLSAEFRAYEGAAMGPVVSKGQYDKIWGFIDEAKAAGCNCVYGGERAMTSALGEGYFIPPTVFVDVPESSRVWRQEIFGPVLCVRSFETEEEAVAIANDTDYGLAAAVFGADATRCDRVARAMRAGITWINCCQPAFIQCPWGGVKSSGFGRELGKWGMEEFTSVKQLTSCASGHSWELW